jgi:hypothetical protein
MPKKINHIERLSESFDALAPQDRPIMLAQLFARLSEYEKQVYSSVVSCNTALANRLKSAPRSRLKNAPAAGEGDEQK